MTYSRWCKMIIFFVCFFISSPAPGQSLNDNINKLPRKKPSMKLDRSTSKFLTALDSTHQELHSLMIVQNGKVVVEKWKNGAAASVPHIMNSVSKTFTAIAVGFAEQEGLLDVKDKIISFFPELDYRHNPILSQITIEHLLTMSSGLELSKLERFRINKTNDDNLNWADLFFEARQVHEPGKRHSYNSITTYILSVILQKATGMKLIDYLKPRLFEPLGITGARWDESPHGVNTGGWGLYIKTEDMAKFGLFLLQKGCWNGARLLSSSWIKRATSKRIITHYDSLVRPDWSVGYGYQIWMCSKYNAFRADGANGQFIIIIPAKRAVIITTSYVKDMQALLVLIWKYLAPAL